MPYRHLINGITLAALLLALTACGQAGPLYLPQKPYPQQQEPAGTN